MFDSMPVVFFKYLITTLTSLILVSPAGVTVLRNALTAGEPQAKLPAEATRKISFQQGVEGYQGTFDTEIWALAAKTILNANPNASSDENNDGGESQVLIRFEDIIGNGPKRDKQKGSTRYRRQLTRALEISI